MCPLAKKEEKRKEKKEMFLHVALIFSILYEVAVTLLIGFRCDI